VKARNANNGQSCIAAKRFIIVEPIADNFERAFVPNTETLKMRDPLDEKTELGPQERRLNHQNCDLRRHPSPHMAVAIPMIDPSRKPK